MRCSLVIGLLILSFSAISNAGVYRHWPLNEGEGDTANDIGPHGVHGEIIDGDSLGFGPGGSVWVDDPERGTVVGLDGAWIAAGFIPLMDLDNDFTWAFWAKQSETQNSPANEIIIGNRWGEDGVDTDPREFIKFTPNRFEYHMLAGFASDLQYQDNDDPERHIPSDEEWYHHTVTKDGDVTKYYRDGELWNEGEIIDEMASEDPLPFFIGGQDGRELWKGWISDVRLYDHALSAEEVLEAMSGTTGNPADVDGDGDVDIDDIEALAAGIRAGNGVDLNGDGNADTGDHTALVKDILNTWIGDSNGDGEFNSSDFVKVFSEGKFETAEAATWGQGDWNGDGVFNSSDFVAAFSDGGFELGPRPAAAAASVPEPSSVLLSVFGFLCLVAKRRR